MTFVHAIVLGVIQGITEFLPVSSSGHLIILPLLADWPQQSLAFDAAVHLGTLFAVCFALKKDLLDLLRSFIGRKGEHTLGWKLIFATVPIAVVGVVFGSAIETLRGPVIVAVSLIVWGVVLWLAELYAKKRSKVTTDVHRSTWAQAFFVGAAQVIALIPGTSRSGVTITAGLFSGLSKETATRFSFLLSIPAIFGAGVFAIVDAAGAGIPAADVSMLGVGFLAAFFSGMLAVTSLLAVVKRLSFGWFALYRVILGVVLLVLFV